MIRTVCAITTVLGAAVVGILYGCTTMSGSPQQTSALGADGRASSNGRTGSGGGAGSNTATCTAFRPITIQPPCHPTTCTPSFCARGDIAPLGAHKERSTRNAMEAPATKATTAARKQTTRPDPFAGSSDCGVAVLAAVIFVPIAGAPACKDPGANGSPRRGAAQ